MVTLNVSYDPGLVLLSAGISLLGGFATVQLCEQYRMAVGSRSKYKEFILMLTGATVSGIVVWGVHYLAMNSLTLSWKGETITVRRSAFMAAMALVTCFVLEVAGLYIAASDTCFNKSSNEIIEMFIAQTTHKYTMSEIKGMGDLKMKAIVLTHKLEHIAFGGLLGGGGIVAMHYIAMQGMRFHGQVSYDAGLVTFSVIVAVLVMITAYFLVFRVLSVFPSVDILRNAVAFTCILNCGVHYIALSAATFTYEEGNAPVVKNASVDSTTFFTGVIVASVAFSTMVSVYSISDLRSWLLRSSVQLRRAETVIENIRKRAAGSTDATCQSISKEIQRYVLRNKLSVHTTVTTIVSNGRGGKEEVSVRTSSTVPLYYDVASDEDSSHNSLDGSTGSATNGAAAAAANAGATAGMSSNKSSKGHNSFQSQTINLSHDSDKKGPALIPEQHQRLKPKYRTPHATAGSSENLFGSSSKIVPASSSDSPDAGRKYLDSGMENCRCEHDIQLANISGADADEEIGDIVGAGSRGAVGEAVAASAQEKESDGRGTDTPPNVYVGPSADMV
jgi:NO-binding membrane sensor protein with MHYT domain